MLSAQAAFDMIERVCRRPFRNLGVKVVNPGEETLQPQARTHNLSPSQRPLPSPRSFMMQGNHDTLNPPVADINSQPGSDATIRVSASSTGNVRRTSDGSYTMKSLKNCKLLPPLPGYRTYRVFECVITIVHNARSYVVDITGNIGAQAIRECIFEELRIPDNLRSNLAIYCAGPGSVIVGSALDNNQLLIECLRFGDDSGSLGFVAQYIDTLLGTITTSENMFNHLGQPPPDRSTAASIRMPQPMISSNHGALLSQHMPSRRVMVAATHDTYNYIVIDLTGYMDGQAVRERILSMLRISDDLHTCCNIYHTQFGCGSIGDSLDNGQLLLDCLRFGDDRGSLKFLVQCAGHPTNNNTLSVFATADHDLPGYSDAVVSTHNSDHQTTTRHIRQSTLPLSAGSRPVSWHGFSSGALEHTRSSSLGWMPSTFPLTNLDPERVKPIISPTRPSLERNTNIETATSTPATPPDFLSDDKGLPKVTAGDISAPLQSDVLPLPTEGGSLETRSSTVDVSSHSSLVSPGQCVNRPTVTTLPASLLKMVEINRTTGSAEIIQHLVLHGCRDITADLYTQSCSEFPIVSGGFGDVYRGQLNDGMLVAIKYMRIFESSESEDRQNHLRYAAREVHTWSKLQHPHVLRLLGLANYRNKIGMVSPWVEGGPLRYHLERTPGVNRPQLCTKIADALSYLHQSGVVHGDLKGDNVLVDDAGEPLVTDFGNAVLQERTLNITFVTSGNHLSFRWAAPELFHGGLRSFETDIYALGMTILETITGKVPYAGVDDIPAMLAITECKLPERSETHILGGSRRGDRLWSLLKDCWTLNPKKRPAPATIKDEMRTIEPGDLLVR